MDQTLLDSSKYRLFTLSLDSRFADQINGGTEDFSIKMPSTYKNIQRIAVSSTEIPMVEYLLSDRKGNTSFYVQVAMGPQTLVTIPEGNYTAATLATALQTALQVVSAGFTCTIDPITGKIRILHATTIFNVTLTAADPNISGRRTDWGIGYTMGFRTKGIIQASVNPAGGYILTSDTIVMVQPPPYYLLQLETPDLLENLTHRVDAGGSVPAFAKLVLRDGVYNIQFDSASDYVNTMHTFLTPVNVSQIRLRVLNYYGEPVDMRCIDWSATVQLYQIVNSRTYNSLSAGYERI